MALPSPKSDSELEVVPAKASGSSKLIAAAVSSVLVGDLVYWLYRFQTPAWSDYAYALFAVAPILLGTFTALILNWKVPHRQSDSILAAFFASLLVSFASVAILWEGFICVIMAFPLLVGFSILGALIGHAIQNARWAAKRRGGLFASLLILVPFAMIADRSVQAPFHAGVVTTSIVVAAPPEKIWPLLLSMNRMPAPDFWMFRVGVAYPTGVSSNGEERHCQLSTGDMPERITMLQANRLLRFNVLSTPPSMHEMNPFGDVHPEHLVGFFECEAGEFRLEPLGDGRTRIVGTSWYHHRFAPNWYWSMWTDTIVHQVQLRVLNEISLRVSQRAS